VGRHRLRLPPDRGRDPLQAECQASRLACPACGAADQPIHDRVPRRWQHLQFFQFKAFIEARVPRVACGQCGKTTQLEVPWSRPGSGFSVVMEAFVIALCQGLPVAQVARLLGVSADRIWRVLEHYIPKARAQESRADLTQLAVDETSSRRGEYISVFFDAKQRRLAFATPGRNASTFKRFAEDLVQHGGDTAAIIEVSMDMSKAFQAGARTQCPQAQISFDPFHVVQLANDGMDQVRRAETKQAPELKGSRWALLKSRSNWNTKQIFVWAVAHYRTAGFQRNEVTLWDAIITSAATSHVKIKRTAEYYLDDFATGLKSVALSPPMSHQVRVNGLPSIVTVIAPVKSQV
jgi:transposase